MHVILSPLPAARVPCRDWALRPTGRHTQPLRAGAVWAWASPHLCCVGDHVRCGICYLRKNALGAPSPSQAIRAHENPLSDTPAFLAVGSEVALTSMTLLLIGTWFLHWLVSFYQKLHCYLSGKNEKVSRELVLPCTQMYPKLKLRLWVSNICWMNKKERNAGSLSRSLNYPLTEKALFL